MSPDTLMVGLAITGALGFFAWRIFAPKKPGCSGGCGCEVAKKPGLGPKPPAAS